MNAKQERYRKFVMAHVAAKDNIFPAEIHNAGMNGEDMRKLGYILDPINCCWKPEPLHMKYSIYEYPDRLRFKE